MAGCCFVAEDPQQATSPLLLFRLPKRTSQVVSALVAVTLCKLV